MRFLPLFLLLSYLSLALPAGAQKAPVRQTKPGKASRKAAAVKKPAPTEAGPVLTFERTPCFGTCPGYRMQVFADGRVDYEGRRAVPLMGQQALKMPAPAVADLLRQARESHFEQFEARYSQGITDLPSTILAIRQPGGQFKTVVVESGEPDNVRELFAYFGSQLDAVAQLKGTEK